MQRTKHSRPTIGVLAGAQVYYGTILGNFIGPVLQGVHAAAQNRGCNVLLACGMEHSTISARPAWPVVMPEVDFVPVGPWNTDGLIVVNPLLSETRADYITHLSATGHPVVFIASGGTGPTITVDNAGGVHQAMRHLVEHGHRRIAFIAGRPDDLEGDSGIRLRAYQAALHDYGLVADHQFTAYGYHGIDGGQRAMRHILNSGVAFTAVLASNDESAIGAMAALREAGLRIPQDIAIIGFDDSLEAITQAPPLTTLHSSPFEMGFQALEVVLKSIEERQQENVIVQVPMRLVIRQSCGCRPDAVPALAFTIAAQQLSSADRSALAHQIKQAMAETVLAEAQRLSAEEVGKLCQQVVAAFMVSLERGEASSFRQAIEQALTQVELAEDDIHVWQAAFLTLEEGAAALLGTAGKPAAHHHVDAMLRLAQIAVSERVRRQYRRHMANQRWITDRMDLLNARLLAALDEAQIFEILAEHLPQMGIQQIEVIFFEAEGNDPVAWSRLHTVPERKHANWHFPSRLFPPLGLCDEPFSLALLPLASQSDRMGCVIFDTANLDICATIVWQLRTFLKVVHLYQEATQGRHLAEEANRLKSRFLSTVSHELRTPLGLIVGLSKMLLQGGETSKLETSQQHLKRIYASAQHLDGLIRDVLDLAQSEMQQLQLVPEPLNLAEVFETVVAVGEQLAGDKGLDWRAEIPDNLPRAWGDRTRLRQVALNLVNNAVKFTSRGGITLRVVADTQTVTVEISDTGLGIPRAEQGVIFDEFRQSERTTARGYGGLGLGLAVCKRLVNLHGGNIGVRSSGKDGAGSTFYFTLPVMAGMSDLDVREAVAPEQTVLVLTEPPGQGNTLRQYLIHQGFEVHVLSPDRSADWLADWLAAPPGAVIVERGMASEQGWGILKQMRENPRTQHIPVLFYTLEEEQSSGSLLALDYLTKPMHMAALAQALERHGLSAGEGQTQKAILIVDDEPGVLEMHAQIVETWSPAYRVWKARNGREAMEMIRSKHLDLILLDLMMPELDGFGVLEMMQRDQIGRDIPVIVLTGQVLTQEDMARLNHGVTNVLKKGLFSIEETLTHVEAALARNKHLGSETQRLVRKAMAAIHEHYTEPISLKDVARSVGISKEYLARCFQQETGLTLVTYLNRYRIGQAKARLEAGEQNLTEIALEVGFSSEPYFSRVFRQEVGMSPSAYRLAGR
jgi:signal transduction histidine kinase/DNA-binding LacI/PurR family transcriptional regulator/AraC-like DNA-binding protein/response regulator of citrate/malate metabolism